MDSPLSVNATEVYRLHPECFNETIYKFLREKENPFGMENLTYIREVAHSMKLNDLKEPAIIISASGMAEAGRIRHHLANNIGNPKNLILFIGYCAEHTLGAQIMSGRNPVNIFGEPHEVRARIASIDSFSGHADKNELRRYVEAISGRHQEDRRRSRRGSAGAGLWRDVAGHETESRRSWCRNTSRPWKSNQAHVERSYFAEAFGRRVGFIVGGGGSAGRRPGPAADHECLGGEHRVAERLLARRGERRHDLFRRLGWQAVGP